MARSNGPEEGQSRAGVGQEQGRSRAGTEQQQQATGQEQHEADEGRTGRRMHPSCNNKQMHELNFDFGLAYRTTHHSISSSAPYVCL